MYCFTTVFVCMCAYAGVPWTVLRCWFSPSVQLSSLHGKCLYPLSHLTAPPRCFCVYFFIDTTVWIMSSVLKVEILKSITILIFKICQCIYVDAVILMDFSWIQSSITILLSFVGFLLKTYFS